MNNFSSGTTTPQSGMVHHCGLKIQLIGNTFAREYIAGSGVRRWSAAESYCLSTYGTHLASIHSAEDNGKVAAICNSVVIVSEC